MYYRQENFIFVLFTSIRSCKGPILHVVVQACDSFEIVSAVLLTVRYRHLGVSVANQIIRFSSCGPVKLITVR